MPLHFTPLPGSEEEKDQFRKLQQSFTRCFSKVFPDKLAEKTIVVIPSLTLDEELLQRLKGHIYYEERMLCMLMLLRMPRTRLVYVSSIPIDDEIISYCLHLLPGVTGRHARQRLTLLSCYDNSAKPLTQKILDRPRLVERIRQAIHPKNASHIACFNVTGLERTLAVQLGIPVYGTDPDLAYLGSKSGSRKIFRRAAIPVPAGIEDLKSELQVIDALVQLKVQNPSLKKALVKTNDGFSGEGNAIFHYPLIAETDDLSQAIAGALYSNLRFVLENITPEMFFHKLQQMEGIVEEYIEGAIKTSPSAQCRIDPDKNIAIISTHDQLLGDADNQVFLGAHFPANVEYNVDIAGYSKKIATELMKEGVLGRFSIDYVSVKEGSEWKHYAIEINLRKGGTTHPFLILQFLSDGEYNADEGLYITASGARRYYFSTDNILKEDYKGLTPHDLVDIAACNGLLYDGAAQEGVMFHMVGSLSQYGKLGVVCIASSIQRANEYFNNVIRALDAETKRQE